MTGITVGYLIKVVSSHTKPHRCAHVCVCVFARACVSDSLVNAYGRVVNWQIKGKKNLAQRLWLGECFKNNFKFAARNFKIVRFHI